MKHINNFFLLSILLFSPLYPDIKITSKNKDPFILRNPQKVPPVTDFAMHPKNPWVITYASLKEAEIYNLKTRKTILKINHNDAKEIDSDILSTAWLNYDDEDGHNPFIIGLKSGKIIRFSVDLDNPEDYDVKKVFDRKQQINHININPTLKEPGCNWWSTTSGFLDRFNDSAYHYLYSKDKEYLGLTTNAIVWPTKFIPHSRKHPCYITHSWADWNKNDDMHIQSLPGGKTLECEKQSNSNNILTLFFGKYENTFIDIRLAGRFKGLDVYPPKNTLIVTGQYEVKKDQKAYIACFDVTKRTDEPFFTFPVHAPGAGVHYLSFFNKILAIGYGCYVDFYHLELDREKPLAMRVGFVAPHTSPIKKLLWWQPDENTLWFFVLDESGYLAGWEIEINDDTSYCTIL